MNSGFCLLSALCVLTLAVGCGQKEGEEVKSASSSPRNTETSTILGEASTPHPAIGDWERSFEWKREQIADRHKILALKDLPDFVQDIRGVGGKPKDGGTFGEWGGVVPQRQVADFIGYLRDLGVPEEFTENKSPFRKSVRGPGWKAPNPPAKQLRFLESLVSGADATYQGLSFEKGKAMVYLFENPNLSNSELHLIFSKESGNVLFIEKCISW